MQSVTETHYHKTEGLTVESTADLLIICHLNAQIRQILCSHFQCDELSTKNLFNQSFFRMFYMKAMCCLTLFINEEKKIATQKHHVSRRNLVNGASSGYYQVEFISISNKRQHLNSLFANNKQTEIIKYYTIGASWEANVRQMETRTGSEASHLPVNASGVSAITGRQNGN